VKLWKKIVAAAAGGFLVGAVGFGFVWASNAATPDARPFGDFPVGQEGVNASGETYGPLDDFDSPPDLFEAAASNGAVGYVRWTDYWAVMGQEHTSLEEALNRKPEEHVLIVYDKDGKTPVGEFTIFPGQEAGK